MTIRLNPKKDKGCLHKRDHISQAACRTDQILLDRLERAFQEEKMVCANKKRCETVLVYSAVTVSS